MGEHSDKEIAENLDPKHYTDNELFIMEPIEIMKTSMTPEAYRGFLLGNIIKYTYRYKGKNGIEDLEKAKVYIDFLKADLLGKEPLYFLHNKE